MNHRHMASADRIEMRAAEYIAVGFGLEAAILIGGGQAPEVGIGDTMLRHKIVYVHNNHLSKPNYLTVLPLDWFTP